MLSTILLIAIAILLIVVLLPVGIAAVRKIITRDKTMRTRTPRETVKIPPLPPQPEPTEMIKLEDTGPARPEPQGTTMMQWYGMLVCTSGPCEGQHFPIDEDGFYIGRESGTSTVVINEARVSKRHVRIMPRNGKVFAIDQNSTNGTFLKSAPGQRITEVQLKRGDEIVIADNAASFRYQI